MLATRSLITIRGEHAVSGWIRGLSAQTLIEGIKAAPSASYLFDDHRVAPAGSRFHVGDATWICRVQGPIEPRDGRAICAAVARGDDPLDFEIRADLHLNANPDCITFKTTNERAVGDMAATMLRHHAADALRRRPHDIAAPEPDVVAALLGRDGLSLRGLETHVFPGFLDIGIAGVCQEASPANRSVIYDRVTGAWHTE
ncbi:MAG: hypothetical protein QGG74_03080 [Phycisphaerales bacterium]|jgi:hypothetical protein|nr:hypothetical protein [Phycisphaerales bacterium]